MEARHRREGAGIGTAGAALFVVLLMSVDVAAAPVGEERSGYERLEDGEEHALPLAELLRRGEAAFTARWTPAEGGGRPFTDGTGGALADDSAPLVGPRSFNRVSGQDANSCAGCHNVPAGRPGGGGDFVTGVFVAAQRFDFASFDLADTVPLRGSRDERGTFATLQGIGNFRATPGMYGSGYIEMLARQMTAELQTIRDATPHGGALELETKGVSFGTIRRAADGAWDVSEVEGLPPQSLTSTGPDDPPGRRLEPRGGVVWVPAFTDLKLHDITAGPGAPGGEAIDINQPAGSAGFFAGNRRFLTRRLWGAASEPPYFHHGRFTTLRQATLAHDGEARASRQAFERLRAHERDAVVEFLKSLQVAVPGERGGRGRLRRQ